MNTRTLFVAISMVVTAMACAQDSLFYADGSVIIGQVEEIGIDQVRYHTISAGKPVAIVVEKRDLIRIKLQGGQAYTFTSAAMDEAHSQAFLGRKHLLSLDMLAPALDHLTIGYEQVIGHRVSLVAKVGYIGLWETERYNDTFNSKGGLISAGVKFTLPRSARRIPSARDAHPLAGWYLRPEVMFSAWTRTYYTPYYYDPYYNPDPDMTKDDYTSAAVILTIGRQLLLGERFTFDICGGLGYGAQWRDGEGTGTGYYGLSRQEYSFTHAFFGETTPLVVSGGLRFGYAF